MMLLAGVGKGGKQVTLGVGAGSDASWAEPEFQSESTMRSLYHRERRAGMCVESA